MQYTFQLLPKEPLRSQLLELRLQLTSLIGPNNALDYPMPHITLLHSIADNSTNSIQVCDQLIAILPAIKNFPIISLSARLLDKAGNHITIAVDSNDELAQISSTLLGEMDELKQQGKLSSIPVEELEPRITLAHDTSPENQELARQYITQNIDWIPEVIEFDQIALLSRDVTLNQPYKIVARTALQEMVEQQ